MQEIDIIEVHWKNVDGAIMQHVLPENSPIPRVGDTVNVMDGSYDEGYKQVVSGEVISIGWTLGAFAQVVIDIKTVERAKRESYELAYSADYMEFGSDVAGQIHAEVDHTMKEMEQEVVYV